jgi:hypothetical protein
LIAGLQVRPVATYGSPAAETQVPETPEAEIQANPEEALA